MSTVEEDLGAAVQRDLELLTNAVSPDALGEEMADYLIASIPQFARRTDEDFRLGTVLSCQSNLNSIWQRLLSGATGDQIGPPPNAIAWAHELVHRGMDLAALLRAYRLGHGLVEKRFEEAASKLEIAPEVRWRVLAHASRCLFAYVDSVCTQLVQDFEEERARWIRGAAAARAELVEAIIDGESVEPRSATATLRYDVSRRHLGFIVWADPPAHGELQRSASLEAAASALAGELGGGPVLTIQIGERVVWGWTAGERVEDRALATTAALREGMWAALGTPRDGLQGMARSHHEARTARRVCEILGSRSGRITRYRSVSLTALLTFDPAEAARFVEAELGELAATSDTMARLRATLRVYLEEKQSPTRAARRLGIHENTVGYRVKQSEEILHRSVDERRLELEIALRLAAGLDGLRATSVQHTV